MTTTKRRSAARKNIRKAQVQWKGMSSKTRALSVPEGRMRQKPGAGEGKFYRIEIRPKGEFVTFRTQDVGERGHLERIAGKRGIGSWNTQTWLIAKQDAHPEGDTLIIDNPKVRTIKELQGPIIHKRGDVFAARPRQNVPERKKPTAAQRSARLRNIKKTRSRLKKRRNGGNYQLNKKNMRKGRKSSRKSRSGKRE